MIDIIKNAYALTKKHALILIGAMLSVFVVSMIFGFITEAFAKIPVLSVIANVASVALQLYLGVALVKLVLGIIDGKEPEFSDIKPSLAEMLKYFSSGLLIALIFIVIFMITIMIMASIGIVNPKISTMFSDIIMNQENIVNYSSKEILYGVGVFLLLSIPALLLYLRLQFANYIVIDKPNETAFTAVMRSMRITKGYLFYIVLTVLSILALNILGLLAFFVGLLFTVPMSFVMFVLLYRSLEHNYEEDTIQTISEE